MKYDIVSAKPGQKLDVLALLKFPADFHGSTKVDHLVKFGDSFTSLIGKSEAKLPKDEVVILEHHYDEARKLMDEVNRLAQGLISDPKKYDDISFCREYFNLAKSGYEMLTRHETEFGLTTRNLIPVSLERAGLVTTRLTLGLDQDAQIDDEVRVVTKRTHLKNEPETNLSVTVKWRDQKQLEKLDGALVLLSDFVNPASGASAAALVVALALKKIQPAEICHRSVSLTRQGTLFMRRALEQMGIKTNFYSVGECDELNQMYYLTGRRAVGDAGHSLRHFLPKWYKE